jgi:hypothetical protein
VGDLNGSLVQFASVSQYDAELSSNIMPMLDAKFEELDEGSAAVLTQVIGMCQKSRWCLAWLRLDRLLARVRVFVFRACAWLHLHVCVFSFSRTTTEWSATTLRSRPATKSEKR